MSPFTPNIAAWAAVLSLAGLLVLPSAASADDAATAACNNQHEACYASCGPPMTGPDDKNYSRGLCMDLCDRTLFQCWSAADQTLDPGSSPQSHPKIRLPKGGQLQQ